MTSSTQDIFLQDFTSELLESLAEKYHQEKLPQLYMPSDVPNIEQKTPLWKTWMEHILCSLIIISGKINVY